MTATLTLGVMGYYAATTSKHSQAWRIHIWEARRVNATDYPERSTTLCHPGHRSVNLPDEMERRALAVANALRHERRACPECIDRAVMLR